ncbi:MAG: TIGR04086 family membrane protein [Clostridia bacterium]|nr:TIGR04086 family membrane protein [Clostridia bacterium]
MKSSVMDKSTGNTILSLLKGLFVSILVSFIGILIFALIIKFFNIPQNLIKPINQIIKFLSIFLGVNSMFKSSINKNLLYAIILGVLYTIVALFIFNLLNSSFYIDLNIFTDSLFGGIAGLICGIISKILVK